MKGFLFDDLSIEITVQTPVIGDLWARNGNTHRAYDAPALQWLHERAARHDAPVFLDVGAHTGLFTCLAAHHAGMTVFAVEPLHQVVPVLRANVRLNDLWNRVFIHQCALSDKAGAIALHVPKAVNLWGMSTTGKPARFQDYDTVNLLAFTLDDFMEFAGMERLDLVKLDTEGAELAILRGGEASIRRFKPDMLIEYEVKNTRQFGYKPHEIKGLLESWGATCEELPPRDLVVTWGDA